MALTVNTNIVNDTDQYLLDAKNVKGTFVVVASITERDKLPTATRVTGSLCYCVADSKFYQYNGSSWAEANLGGSVDLSGYAKTSDLEEMQNEILAGLNEIIEAQNALLGG